jgi:OmcA/MtrC family decaheme c-type cytochrome
MSATGRRTALLGMVLGIAAAPFAFASSDGDKNLERFFEPLPPEVVAEFAPGADRGDVEGKYASSVTASGDATTQQEFDPLPIEKVTPIITSVSSLDTLPVFEFTVRDQFGFGVEGFKQGENVEFEFTVSKLVPAQNGKTAYFRTYMVADDQGAEAVSAGAYLDGTLEDLGDGNYRFTFDEGLEAISGGRETFRPSLTHRVGMEIRDPAPFGEEVEGSDTAFDILPATGETEEDGIASKNLVVQENCSVCHGEETFAFHGGPRQSVKQCVSCHQPFKRDGGANKETIDFGPMIHGIHNAQNLTQGGLVYCGYGCENFGAPPDDFSHVVYPQSVKNCTVCHDPSNPATPEASNIDSKATAASCASCHDDLAYDNNGLTNANGNHIGLAQPNETCEACHAPNGLLQGNLAYHEIPSQVAAQRIAYEVLDVSNTGEGQSPVVTFRVIDPTDGSVYDLATAPEFNGDATSFSMTFAWPTTDFVNVANDAGTEIVGRTGGRSLRVRIARSNGLQPWVVDNGDGTYTVDTGTLDDPVVIPSTTPPLGSGQVTFEGHPAGDFDGDGVYDDDIPVTNLAVPFAITDAAPTPRRQVVALSKCKDCHNVNDGLAFHGGNRTDSIESCVSCHHPSSTDINDRPVDPDGTANGVNAAAADGLEDQTVNMAYMVHAIHAASVRNKPYLVYGDASYSRSPAECQACHDGDSYALPLGDARMATTVNTGATAIEDGFAPSEAAARDPSDDNRISPETAACVACHDSRIAIDHMSVRSDSGIAFGNGWLANPMPIEDPDTQAFIDAASPENCAFCHSEGSFVPVGEVHLID